MPHEERRRSERTSVFVNAVCQPSSNTDDDDDDKVAETLYCVCVCAVERCSAITADGLQTEVCF